MERLMKTSLFFRQLRAQTRELSLLLISTPPLPPFPLRVRSLARTPACNERKGEFLSTSFDSFSCFCLLRARQRLLFSSVSTSFFLHMNPLQRRSRRSRHPFSAIGNLPNRRIFVRPPPPRPCSPLLVPRSPLLIPPFPYLSSSF